MLNLEKIIKDFPILSRKIGDANLVYLDNGATTQKPLSVIDAISNHYKNTNANVHRGIHLLSEEATTLFEEARKKVADFINADVSEIIFTGGTTESLNRVARTWCTKNLQKGDIVLTTLAEHHSNFIPWQIYANQQGATLEIINITPDGLLDLADLKVKIKNPKVKLIAISHASNVLGTIYPVKEICKIAEDYGVKVSVDGAQGIPHLKVNVKALGCDFYSFSGHKMLGPTGIGVLWVKKEILETLEPYEYGGGMISSVSLEKSQWAEIPEKFEAGTPNIAGAIGLGAAVDYLNEVGMEEIRTHELELLEYVLPKLQKIEGLTILGPLDPKNRTGLVSFTLQGIHGHDIAAVLNTKGVAVRSGHHCAMPLHTFLNVASSTRASFYLYNTKQDMDSLVDAIMYAKKILG
jgi:cysteine desulfurase/selenocysteine lyase